MNHVSQTNKSAVSFIRFGCKWVLYSLGCILVAVFVTACPAEDNDPDTNDSDTNKGTETEDQGSPNGGTEDTEDQGSPGSDAEDTEDQGSPGSDAEDSEADNSLKSVDCSSEECPQGDYCDRTVSPAVCRNPPTGQGKPCTAQEDCAGYEADYCETMVSGTCLVQNCSVEFNNCTDDYLCCDFSSWEDLPDSLCVADALSGGKCV